MKNLNWYVANVLAGLLVFSCALCWAADEAGIAIGYNLPEDGRVSMLICSSEGPVVRELLHAAPREKGKNTEVWDGLDERGKPVPAGEYIWKLLLTQGLRAEYLLTLGTNPAARSETPASSTHSMVTGSVADELSVLIAVSSAGASE